MHQKNAGVLNPDVDFRGLSLESLQSLLTLDLIEIYILYICICESDFEVRNSSCSESPFLSGCYNGATALQFMFRKAQDSFSFCLIFLSLRVRNNLHRQAEMTILRL